MTGTCRGAPPRSRTWIGSLRRRWPFRWASGAWRAERESNPRARFCRPRSSSENRLGAGGGSRTRVGSLEDCGPTVERSPRTCAPGGSRTRSARAKSPFGKRASLHDPRETVPGASATLSSPPPRAAFPVNVAHGCARRSRSPCPALRSTGLARFPVPFLWTSGAVESARLELASPGCRPGILPLNYDPDSKPRAKTGSAGREGIEPSLRVLEARLVTMTLRPRTATRVRRGHCPQVGLPPDAADDGWRRRHGGGRWNRTDVLLTAFAERLVRELNPSHSVDSGAATPVASRGMFASRPRQESNLHPPA